MELAKVELLIREFEQFMQENSTGRTDYNEEVLGAVHDILIEQRPVAPTKEYVNEVDGSVTRWFNCGACRMPVTKWDRYCCHCGRRIDWK